MRVILMDVGSWYSFLDDLLKYAFRTFESLNGDTYEWVTEVDSKTIGKHWMLASNMSAWSDPHIDSAGFCTAIRIMAGSKLWLVGSPKNKSEPIFPLDDGAEWAIEKAWWDAVHLQPGDTLYVDGEFLICSSELTSMGDSYMHPNTPHIVLTTRSCIIEGIHFYNFSRSHDTFAAMVAEHFAGAAITNAEYPRASLLYFKAIGGVAADFQAIYGNDTSTEVPMEWNGEFARFHCDISFLCRVPIPAHSSIARQGITVMDDVRCFVSAKAAAGDAG